jgi:DNA-nicking Smr family endonuclease
MRSSKPSGDDGGVSATASLSAEDRGGETEDVARRKKRRATRRPQLGFSGDLLDATPVAKLDLHGDTALEAERRVKDFILTQSRIARGQVVHIVTGRGLGSPGRPVLPGAVRKVLTGEMAGLVQEFDRDLDEAGFLVRLK